MIRFILNHRAKIFLSRVHNTVKYTEQIEYTVLAETPILSTIRRGLRIFRRCNLKMVTRGSS